MNAPHALRRAATWLAGPRPPRARGDAAFAAAVREARIRAGMSREALGLQTDCPHFGIWLVERGSHLVPPSWIERIASRLGLEPVTEPRPARWRRVLLVPMPAYPFAACGYLFAASSGRRRRNFAILGLVMAGCPELMGWILLSHPSARIAETEFCVYQASAMGLVATFAGGVLAACAMRAARWPRLVGAAAGMGALFWASTIPMSHASWRLDAYGVTSVPAAASRLDESLSAPGTDVGEGGRWTPDSGAAGHDDGRTGTVPRFALRPGGMEAHRALEARCRSSGGRSEACRQAGAEEADVVPARPREGIGHLLESLFSDRIAHEDMVADRIESAREATPRPGDPGIGAHAP